MRYDHATGECTEYRPAPITPTVSTSTHRDASTAAPAAEDVSCGSIPAATWRWLPHLLDGQRHNRPNDLAIDRKGRIWFTDPSGQLTADERELDHASFLRLDPAPGVRRRMDPAPDDIRHLRAQRAPLFPGRANALRGAKRLRRRPGTCGLTYYGDDDTLGQFTVLHVFGEDFRGVHRGLDGMCLDTEGNIIAAGGWRQAGPGPLVYVFSPAGRVIETHPVPADWPTNCAFGGPALDTLYVTTRGHLFRVNNTGRRGWVLYPL